MASVHLLSAAPDGPGSHPKAHLDLEQMRSSARSDAFGVHRVVNDPSSAELIIFVETSVAAGRYFERVRRHPVYREYKSKSYLFSSTDRVVPFLPGVFASIERRWYWPSWTRSGHYLGVTERPELQYDPDASMSRLFSFVGTAAAHPVRRRIMALNHPEAILLDACADAVQIGSGGSPPPSANEFLERYARSVRESSFVICPRGGERRASGCSRR